MSPAHEYAVDQEKLAAKTYGGYTTPQSGAGALKGDVRVKGVYRIECKCTMKNSFGLKLDYLQNCIEQASSRAEDFFMQLHFIDENKNLKKGFVIVPEEDIKEYLIERTDRSS